MMRFWRKVILLAVIVFLSGCATWRDRYGNPASSSDQFECDQKCGLYDSRMNSFGYAMCANDCMRSKGYSSQH